jgi:hypothetical protein
MFLSIGRATTAISNANDTLANRIASACKTNTFDRDGSVL